MSIPSSDREPSRSLSVQILRDADERKILELFRTDLKTLILEEQKHVSHDGFFEFFQATIEAIKSYRQHISAPAGAATP